MIFSYQTLRAPTQGSYKEKGSKFLAFAYPVASEDEIKANLEVLKREYFDARHYCYAWMLGPDRKMFRAFDDGEPNHSAGDPILGQIRSRNMTNVLVVVVRYFGGIKLGVGGLISAYKTAAEDALNAAVIVEREVVERTTLQYDYSATPEVMKMVKEFDLTIINQDFLQDCKLAVDVPLRHKEKFMMKVGLMNALGIPLSVNPTLST